MGTQNIGKVQGKILVLGDSQEQEVQDKYKRSLI